MYLSLLMSFQLYPVSSRLRPNRQICWPILHYQLRFYLCLLLKDTRIFLISRPSISTREVRCVLFLFRYHQCSRSAWCPGLRWWSWLQRRSRSNRLSSKSSIIHGSDMDGLHSGYSRFTRIKRRKGWIRLSWSSSKWMKEKRWSPNWSIWLGQNRPRRCPRRVWWQRRNRSTRSIRRRWSNWRWVSRTKNWILKCSFPLILEPGRNGYPGARGLRGDVGTPGPNVSSAK